MYIAGFCIDLMDTIASATGFTYEIYRVGDGKFGAKDSDTGEWNGMIKDLVLKVFQLCGAGVFPLQQIYVYIVCKL